MENFLEKFPHLKHFNLKEIKSITGDFDNSKVIGKGGFGKVYEGMLSDSDSASASNSDSKGKIKVACKRLDINSGQGIPEFLKEILMLSRYKHENLISLLGFCDEGGEKILVYEHASRGSLDLHLSSMTLTWTQRLKICLGAARGLCFLHDPKETRERLIHRDIKSSNILIDESWNAKVSDMGLSQIGPANQQHTFIATNVAGTIWYIDPMYMKTSILTKESDVYSFGVVLFEVLCGSLCFEHNNDGQFQSLVSRWRKSYKQGKLDDIIFHNLKQGVDQKSLETFAEIAYQCLLKSRAERPKMSHVVEKLEIALHFADVVKIVVNKEQLSKGILVNEGNTWLSLDKNGELCEMISAECFESTGVLKNEDYVPFGGGNKSRFEVRKRAKWLYDCLKINVRTQFLSPGITYTVNLVFKIKGKRTDFFGLIYKLTGEPDHSISFSAHERGDGWLMADHLCQFICDKPNVDLNINLRYYCGTPLEVEGIEFQPMERVQHEVVLEDKDVAKKTYRYWKQKLPNDWEEILKLSKYSLGRTTKKELYSIFCKGFPIRDDKEWFSLTTKGKKCHMPLANLRITYKNNHYEDRSLRGLRFSEVAAFDDVERFMINCQSNMLSPETTYAAYLVFKLQENHSRFEPPVKVRIAALTSGLVTDRWYIYLLAPQAPLIRGKVYQNKSIPQQRSDSWMEVALYEFHTDTTPTTKWFTMCFGESSEVFRSFEGLIVRAIEFKPI